MNREIACYSLKERFHYPNWQMSIYLTEHMGECASTPFGGTIRRCKVSTGVTADSVPPPQKNVSPGHYLLTDRVHRYLYDRVSPENTSASECIPEYSPPGTLSAWLIMSPTGIMSPAKKMLLRSYIFRLES